MRQVVFDGSLPGWREEARGLLAESVPPAEVEWMGSDAHQGALALGSDRATRRWRSLARPMVPRGFLRLAGDVACYRHPGRWDALYRALWRLTRGEPHLLALAADPDVQPLLAMASAVRRAAHKMQAFVRFRSVGAGEDLVYVAWFEPAHYVVERTAPFFARRFAAMRWSILTPDGSAYWDRRSLRFGPGVSRGAAPADDELESLWRTYYAGAFNPARLNLAAMRAEMPKRYWSNLPEATLVPELVRRAPQRVAAMLAQRDQPAEPLPDDCQPVSPAPAPLTPGWDPVHDPGLAAARARAERARRAAPQGLATPHGSRILIGAAGWTDPTLTATTAFYPAGIDSPETRLRYYASCFPLAEVDATYYAMPTRGMAVQWAARTPDGFTFDVKAHGLMTGHSADARRLPDWLRRALPQPAGERVSGRALPGELLDEVWLRFLHALEPLRSAGKLGAILLQFPRWFTPSRRSAGWLRRARERLGDVPGAVELRQRDWMSPRLADRTLGLLRELELAYVVVDGPQGLESSMPHRAAVTSDRLAVYRLHGRRRDTWEARNDPATERYRYLYSEEELREQLERVLELSAAKDRAVHVVYNNCHGNYGVTNALELGRLLLGG
jgi:probable DNA metabolism protein